MRRGRAKTRPFTFTCVSGRVEALTEKAVLLVFLDEEERPLGEKWFPKLAVPQMGYHRYKVGDLDEFSISDSWIAREKIEIPR